jgi:hypothetical protein
MIPLARFLCQAPAPLSRHLFFPETHPAILRHRPGTLASPGGTPALRCGTEAVHMGNNCGFNALEQAMKRNIIDMFRLYPET